MQKFNKILFICLIIVQLSINCSSRSDLELTYVENLLRATSAYKMYKRFGSSKIRPQLNNNVSHGQGFSSNNLVIPTNNNNFPMNNNQKNLISNDGNSNNLQQNNQDQFQVVNDHNVHLGTQSNNKQLNNHQINQAQHINNPQGQMAQCPTCKQQILNNVQKPYIKNNFVQSIKKPAFKKAMPFAFRKKRRFS